MTTTQLKNKIADLEFWLTNNPEHPNYNTVLKDKLKLESDYAYQERNQK
jgi:hypothetical protein